ncbi:hypothetical protein AB9K26_09260 [Psychroserpens sp. XS_ASV72]|uniref:hypothetical protein n=1 Tax=Psychroserpens sp. XS_ASV72 TaxID=3241293 RepID=UPI003515A57B
MKNFTLILLSLIAFCGSMSAQQEKGIIGYDNWLNPWTEFSPNKVDYNKPTQILSGKISKDTKLYKSDIYLLLGDVYVTDSTTLTIEPGTIIMGDFESKGSLIVSGGSKLVADGTKTDPIVFTSNRSVKKPGDWGGVFVLGNAPMNTISKESTLNNGLLPKNAQYITYGGDNADDNSGILRYVRIEYAGKRTKGYDYFSGLTLAGVGQQTIVENVMVSYCEGKSFDILGGNLFLDKLVSYKSNGHDYEFNYGTQCKITNSLAVRSPYVSGPSVPRAMSVVSYHKKDEVDAAKEQTLVVAENLTLINLSDDLDYDISVGLVNEAIFIGEDVSFISDKSVISGFNPAVVLDKKIKINADSMNKIQFTRTYFNNCNGNIFRDGFTNNDDLENWYGNRAFNNVYSKGPDSETFIDVKNRKRPDFRLRINRIIASSDIIED